MKIAQVVDKFLPITESWIYSQIKGLEKLGLKSEIFCHKIINTDSYKHKIIHSYKDLPQWKVNYYRSLGKLMKRDGATLYWNSKIKNKRFDLVHSHFGWAAQKGIDLAIRNNIPHVATFYGADITRDSIDPSKKKYQNILPIIFDYSKIILCTSDFLRKNLIKLGAPKNKVKVWHPGISIDIPKVDKRNDGIFRIISVGRFIDWKGQRFLIKALPKVISKHPDILVNFIGTGPELEKCKKLVKSLNIQNKVNFLGNKIHSEVLCMMHQSDVLVHPSIRSKNGQCDTLGVVLAEAAMCGIPAIATNLGGMPEIVIDNQTGMLVEEKGYNDIANKIIKYIENTSLRTVFSNNARAHSKNIFNYKNQINSLYKLIIDK